MLCRFCLNGSTEVALLLHQLALASGSKSDALVPPEAAVSYPECYDL